MFDSKFLVSRGPLQIIAYLRYLEIKSDGNSLETSICDPWFVSLTIFSFMQAAACVDTVKFCQSISVFFKQLSRTSMGMNIFTISCHPLVTDLMLFKTIAIVSVVLSFCFLFEGDNALGEGKFGKGRAPSSPPPLYQKASLGSPARPHDWRAVLIAIYIKNEKFRTKKCRQ